MKNNTSQLNIDSLKQFLIQYGEIRALKDISLICQDLSQEWFSSGDRRFGFVFSDAASSIAEVVFKLESAEKRYTVSKDNQFNSINIENQELNSLTTYFKNLSLKEFAALFGAGDPTFITNLKRLDELKTSSLKNKLNDK